jgi:peptidoglycan biosynthesis protein MviN/MurJ (putative lipid II flippase)
MRAMFLRAGLVSLALLLVSRVLGLLRESVQAAALGAGGLADVAILVLTLPDLLTGILASGALAYVLLPLWARQSAAAQAQGLQLLGRWLLVGGGAVAVALLLTPGLVTTALAPGIGDAVRPMALSGLRWSAAALPLALLAALWTTRLQHQRDFTGMYGANLVVNAVVIGSLLLIATTAHDTPARALFELGLGLLVAMALRLLWLRWRLARAAQPTNASAAVSDDRWPLAGVWLWALASAGLPLLLPLLARSLASGTGEGALTTFNYAWKLVELPLVLAIQLVASLAFPGIARAFAAPPAAGTHTARRDALRQAFVLAWVLACAAAAALAGLAPSLAQLLFGWGRMPPEAVAQIADWARVGAWSLLPQALLAVLLTLMASTGRLRHAVGAYGLALAVLAAGAWLGSRWGLSGGGFVMGLVNAALALAALALCLSEREHVCNALAWRDLLPAALAAVCVATMGASWQIDSRWSGLLLAVLAAGAVIGVAWLASPGLRRALRR